MKKKVYIAGKVSGENIHKCTMKFGDAATQLEVLGFEPINPLEVVNDWESTWENAMRKCITALMQCDYLLALDDCKNSDGAQIELLLAKRLGIIIFHGIKDFETFN